MRQGTSNFIKERLTQVRKMRGFTSRKALADLIGKNSSTVGRWEDGSSLPETSSLWALSKALDVKPEFFLKPMLITNDSKAFFYRSLASTLKRDKGIQEVRMKWLQEISSVVQQYVDFPKVDIPDVLGNHSYRQLRNGDLERIASELRDHWKLGDGPLLDVISHMENVGYVVGSVTMGTSKLDGLCQWGEDDRPYVLLADDKMSYARRQLDAAHEMAHGILHKSVSPKELVEDFKLIEQQAFRLAGAFLLPASSYPLEVNQFTLSELELKKQRWRISIKAQIRRLKDLKLINDNKYVHMNKIYSARRWRGGEPFDRVWALEKPKLLKQAFEAIVSNQVLSKQDILRQEFAIPAADIEELSGLPEGWFDVGDSAQIVQLKSN